MFIPVHEASESSHVFMIHSVRLDTPTQIYLIILDPTQRSVFTLYNEAGHLTLIDSFNMEPRPHRHMASALPKLRSGRTKAVAAPRQANTKVQSRKPKMQPSSRQPGMKLRSGRYKVEAKVEAPSRRHGMKLRSDISPRGKIPQTHPITEKMYVKFPYIKANT